MRVLTVGNMYPPLHEGGYELVWQAAVGFLRERGHTVAVLTTDHRAGESRLPEPGISRQLRWYWRDRQFPRFGLRARLAIERENAEAFDRNVAQLAPDVVAWWSMGGMSLSLIERARRARLASVGVVCDDWMLYGPNVDAWMSAFGERRWLRPVVERATGIPTNVDLGAIGPCLFPSETTLERARSRWPLTDATVCHQGVSPELFAEAPQPPWRWRLLYVGRIDRRKGIDLAVEALAALPTEATLTIAGSGDDAYRTELETLAGSLGLSDRVVFTSRPRSELRELYADADAIVFPVRWHEPWGLVPLEAMMVGRPVVATGLGGSGEYLSDGENCLIFDPESGAGQLAERLRALAADEKLRARLREGGLATAARFGEDDFSEAFERLVERASNARI
jgi:glycosyltransferase involved in cell wall biosynthesis